MLSEGTKAKTKEQVTFICISLSMPYPPHTGLNVPTQTMANNNQAVSRHHQRQLMILIYSTFNGFLSTNEAEGLPCVFVSL